MVEHSKKIIDDAIREEEYTYNLYMHASEKAGNESLKAILKKLAEQEKLHKKKLQTLDPTKIELKETPKGKGKLDVSEELTLTPLEELGNIRALLKFAIRLEANARKNYRRMADSVSDENARGLFTLLSSEERLHEMLLTDAARNMGMQLGVN